MHRHADGVSVYLCRFNVLFSFILSKLGQSSYGYDGDLAVKQRTRTTKAGEREKERDLQTSTSSGRSETKERQDRKGKKGLTTGNLQVLERPAHPSAASPSLFLRPASVFSLFTDVVVIGEGRMPHPPLHLKLKKKVEGSAQNKSVECHQPLHWRRVEKRKAVHGKKYYTNIQIHTPHFASSFICLLMSTQHPQEPPFPAVEPPRSFPVAVFPLPSPLLLPCWSRRSAADRRGGDQQQSSSPSACRWASTPSL